MSHLLNLGLEAGKLEVLSLMKQLVEDVVVILTDLSRAKVGPDGFVGIRITVKKVGSVLLPCL